MTKSALCIEKIKNEVRRAVGAGPMVRALEKIPLKKGLFHEWFI